MTADITAKPHPWAAEIRQGRADAAAGRTVDLDTFIADLEAEDVAIIHEPDLLNGGAPRGP